MSPRPRKRIITCRPKYLPQEHWIRAARHAVAINPMNHSPGERMSAAMPGFVDGPMRIAVRTKRYWGPAGVHLTVGFLDNPPAALRKKILLHMNAWNKMANVKFSLSNTDPVVRIARIENDPENDGYWSYLGTEIKEIEPDQPTMNLEQFTLKTPDAEFYRVVRHETGHTMGFDHEHMRRELVQLIDVKKAIAFYREDQHWSEQEVRDQVLTPIEERSIRGTLHADPNSIMCYQIDGSITKNGKPILGGLDIDKLDYEFAGLIYPKAVLAHASKAKKKSKKKTRRQA
ncbi:MAG TPA: M12 family metallopeptidase [Gemmatimonadaceae bacterium]|nr:M12 family metallopeptidase [Gemmatimonadaceae bacterium]